LERFNPETLQKTTPRYAQKLRGNFSKRFNPEALQKITPRNTEKPQANLLKLFNPETLQKTTPRNLEKPRGGFLKLFNPGTPRSLFETFQSRNDSKNHPEEPREASRWFFGAFQY
jgi:hypothetical protein